MRGCRELGAEAAFQSSKGCCWKKRVVYLGSCLILSRLDEGLMAKQRKLISSVVSPSRVSR